MNDLSVNTFIDRCQEQRYAVRRARIGLFTFQFPGKETLADDQ